MSKDYTKELEKMQHLMSFGMDESKNSNSSNGIIEYSQIGANGKTYGIIREGTKYFIKVAPKKDTQILAEDYDYIGGYLNRKSYDSYTKASNALNLELIHVNESNGSKTPVKSQFNINESSEWENTKTKEAKTELSRFYQLCENIDNLLDENVHYIKEDKNAPFTNKPSTKDGGGHKGNDGKQQPLGIKEKDYTNANSRVNPQTIYNKNGVKGDSPSGKYNAANGVETISNDEGNPYQDKARTSKEQGDTIANESKKHIVKLTERQKKQVLAWRGDRAFVHPSSDSELDNSHGTEIGDTAPYCDTVNEEFEVTSWDDGLPQMSGIGTPKKYKKPFCNQNDVTQPVSESIYEIDLGGEFDDEDIRNSAEDIIGSDLNSDDSSIYDHLDTYGEGDDSLGVGFNDDTLADLPNSDGVDDVSFDDGYYDDDTFDDNDDYYDDEDISPIYEAVKRIVEDELHDFGKHPAYQKVVMSLPKNADGSKWGNDWNDESAKGEEPYGNKIGSLAPFDDVVSDITNAVVTSLSKKKE